MGLTTPSASPQGKVFHRGHHPDSWMAGTKQETAHHRLLLIFGERGDEVPTATIVDEGPAFRARAQQRATHRRAENQAGRPTKAARRANPRRTNGVFPTKISPPGHGRREQRFQRAHFAFPRREHAGQQDRDEPQSTPSRPAPGTRTWSTWVCKASARRTPGRGRDFVGRRAAPQRVDVAVDGAGAEGVGPVDEQLGAALARSRARVAPPGGDPHGVRPARFKDARGRPPPASGWNQPDPSAAAVDRS